MSGLDLGVSLNLQGNSGDDLTLTGADSSQNFAFATGLASGAAYAVTKPAQPTGQKCTVTQGSGSNVSNVAVQCVNLREAVMHSFGTGSDGLYPLGGLILDASGNLYGTTYNGGKNGKGTVFKITPTGQESVLWSFGGAGDGQYPVAGLVLDGSGNLYGTTINGGTNGTGTVFRLVLP